MRDVNIAAVAKKISNCTQYSVKQHLFIKTRANYLDGLIFLMKTDSQSAEILRPSINDAAKCSQQTHFPRDKV